MKSDEKAVANPSKLEEKTSDALSPKRIDAIIAKHLGKPGQLLGLLENLQSANKYKYLPKETLEYVSKKTKVPLSRLYSVVTFYAFFNLKPQGKHTIVVCRGTACHTKNSRKLLDAAMTILALVPEPDAEKIFLTTLDKEFTLKTVACFGQCALAPVVEVDGCVHSNMNQEKLRRVIGDIRAGGTVK